LSKLSPLGQSMAALFTPEGEKARKAQAKGASPATGPGTGGIRIPNSQAVGENAKSGDSLGNPSSPGYSPLPINKKDAEQQEVTEESAAPKGHETFQTPTYGPETIRLDSGFETLLLTQHKLCEKAEAVFTKLDAPGRYKTQRKGRLLNGKSRGCIVDVAATQDLAAPPKKDDAA
jgi:hypothetical protein